MTDDEKRTEIKRRVDSALATLEELCNTVTIIATAQFEGVDSQAIRAHSGNFYERYGALVERVKDMERKMEKS